MIRRMKSGYNDEQQERKDKIICRCILSHMGCFG
jgi:hypothetical protein